MEVLSEVAAVAQGGLQINEPGKSRSLKTLPGTWSDLALARSGCAPLQPQPPGLHACHFFRHHPCPNGNLLLACYLPPGSDRPWRAPRPPLQRLDAGAGHPAQAGVVEQLLEHLQH